MSEPVRLLFGVHAHQPAGNFAAVVDDAHARCYRPFLHVLHRHPEFPFAIHVSGWLLATLAKRFPEDVALLREMVQRGQAEVVGGGDTEPVLAAIPDADRRGQIRAMSARLRRLLGARPRGAWLTERVWEATVVPALADSGIRYAMVDDYHFLCTGKPAAELDGRFSTEEDSARLDLFPISEALRYRVPFAPVPEAIGHLEAMGDGAAAIYFDDIEKFGIWPETYAWVYERRWLEDFIEAVARSPRIRPMQYGEHLDAERSRGIVYLPTVSYSEMGKWTLPAAAARRYASLVERSKREGTFADDKPYLRGAHWRNFFSRYPEANWIHKRMEQASRRFHALPPEDRTPGMRADLHLAQANDAYWHGLFGGIYLPHLRRNVYAALARLERAMHKKAPRPDRERVDLDLDDLPEVLLSRPELFAAVRPHDGASVCELTHYGLAHNFCDVIARREEHYYDAIRARPPGGETGLDGGIASIHDRVAFRTAITEADLAPDRRPRSSFLDAWRSDGGAEADAKYVETGARRGPFASFLGGAGPLAVSKRIALEPVGVAVDYRLAAREPARGAFVIDIALAMPSCDGPGGRFEVDGVTRGRFAERIAASPCRKLHLLDSELPGSIALELSEEADVVAEPLYTVSQSEAGFEKIMQAVAISVTWRVDLAPAETRLVAMRLAIDGKRRRR